MPVFAAFRQQKIIPNSYSDALSLSDSFMNESINRLNDSVSRNDSLVNRDLLPSVGDLISHLKSIFIFKIILNISIQSFMFKMSNNYGFVTG